MPTEKNRTRVIIAEDHVIARAGVSAIINAQPDMMVVAEAVDGEQALIQYRSHLPDVMVMDMWMPVKSGFEAIAAIRTEFPSARIVALSTFGEDEDVRRALLAGARAYLTKDILHDELIAAIRTVNAGESYLTPRAVAVLGTKLSRADLSSRELEVLELVVHGLSNKQIAWNCGITENTVKNHVKSILKKLGADDRTQAATAAIQRGIVHLQRWRSAQDK
jgi:DNA-binding NarL/FixJ family response regulator